MNGSEGPKVASNPITLPPPAPENVSATSNGDTVTVTWHGASTATSYHVYVWDAAGGCRPIGTVSATLNNTENTEYSYDYYQAYSTAEYYFVVAVNGAGEGPQS